jgi:hypothetical protein
MHMMKLEWKECNVDLASLDLQLRAAHPAYVGNQAHAHLELWFSEEPTQEAKETIEALWASIDAEHALAVSYKSAAQIQSAAEAKKESAKAKLAALGLDAEELKAILG